MISKNKNFILGLGADLTSISRISKIIDKFGSAFLSKVLTSYEIEVAQKIKSDNHLRFVRFCAKRFAAKEAFSKAVGLGIGRGINFKDIEINNNQFGKPEIALLNKKDDFLKRHLDCKNFFIYLSLSDELDMASATVIIEKHQ